MSEQTNEGQSHPSFAIPADSHITLALLPQQLVPLGELKTPFRTQCEMVERREGGGNCALGSSFSLPFPPLPGQLGDFEQVT